MAEREPLSSHAIADILSSFVDTGRNLLDIAENESRHGSLQEFIQKKISIENPKCLLGLIEAGAEMYKRMSLKTKTEAETTWKRAYHCAEVQEAVENYFQLGVQWDAFLEKLDSMLEMSDKAHVQPARFLPSDVSLVDARTGETLMLGKYLGRGEKILLVLIRQFSCLLCRIHLNDLQTKQAALDAHGVRVVVVSFGCQEGALHWLKETGCQYDLLLDPHRNIYTLFGLGASLTRVLNFNNMLLYADYILSDHEFPRPLPSIQDDMFQLGGDFVLDEQGKVMFSHRCKSPIDRPAVEEILSALNTTNLSTA
ncbi:prostamide/prostaglandin F synthase-like [Chanos chanos]|uniref:Prostamide/prostaglandin F synthase-like n=1 Tax=Chanos chanos TaxID=29144 RepID=A0A6J2WFD6_CHACN|nr:prostamide/prostaglandin F synthase-like [Chanos chanos]